MSADGTRFSSAGSDKLVKVWDVVSGKEIETLLGHAGPALAVAIAPDNRTVYSASTDKTVRISTVGVTKLYLGHAGPVNGLAMVPNGAQFLSAGEDKSLKQWDVAQGTLVRSFDGQPAPLLSLAVSPDGQKAVTGSADKTAKIWVNGQPVATLTGHEGPVVAVRFTIRAE